MGEPGSLEAKHFALNLRTPYLLAYPIARAVAPWVGAVVAWKLVVWLAVVANMLALAALARRLGHDPWIALLGFVASLGLCFYWGFISSCRRAAGRDLAEICDRPRRASNHA